MQDGHCIVEDVPNIINCPNIKIAKPIAKYIPGLFNTNKDVPPTNNNDANNKRYLSLNFVLIFTLSITL